MGHQRYGPLPHTRQWRQIVAVIAAGESTSADIADATLRAADDALQQAQARASGHAVVLLLTRLASAAGSADFFQALALAGIRLDPSASPVQFASAVSRTVGEMLRRDGIGALWVDITTEAIRETVTRELASRPVPLWEDAPHQIQDLCRDLSQHGYFGRFMRRFFSVSMFRTLDYFVSKEIANHVGPDRRLSSIEEMRQTSEHLRDFCWESAEIVQKFAQDWHSRHTWLDDIDERSARAFVSHATRKLRNEIGQVAGDSRHA